MAINSYGAGMANSSLRLTGRGNSRSPTWAVRKEILSSRFHSSSGLVKNAIRGSNMRLLTTVSIWNTSSLAFTMRPMRLQESVRGDRVWSKYEFEARIAWGVWCACRDA